MKFLLFILLIPSVIVSCSNNINHDDKKNEYNQKKYFTHYCDSMSLKLNQSIYEFYIYSKCDSVFILQSLFLVSDSLIEHFNKEKNITKSIISCWRKCRDTTYPIVSLELKPNNFKNAELLRFRYENIFNYLMDSNTINVMDNLRQIQRENFDLYKDSSYSMFFDMTVFNLLVNNFEDSISLKNKDILIDYFISSKKLMVVCNHSEIIDCGKERKKKYRKSTKFLSILLKELGGINSDSIDIFDHTYNNRMKYQSFTELIKALKEGK